MVAVMPEPNAVVEHHDDHHGEEHDDHHAEEVALLSVAEVEHSSDVHHGEEGHADEAHGGDHTDHHEDHHGEASEAMVHGDHHEEGQLPRRTPHGRPSR